MKYIIKPGIEIGNPKNKTINVLTPEEVDEYHKNGFKIKERTYQVTVGQNGYEVNCLEIWQKGDKEHSLIIPAFLMPHRVYPVYVYVYAINLYSSSQQLSQRKVAEATRKKYGLETFAHTTVGRAMKALAKTLTETAVMNNETTESTEHETGHNEANAGKMRKGRFPSVKDTSAIRDTVKSFFYAKLKNRCQEEIKETCDRIAMYWYTQFRRLLMNTAPVFGCKLSGVIQNT